MNLDFKYGYKYDTFQLWGSVEELRLSKTSDNEDSAGALLVGDSPLYRIHTEYIYDRLPVFDYKPFAGWHKRKQYDAEDGYYGGLQVMTSFYLLELSGMIMYDNNYTTISPRLKFWFLELEYAFKTANKSSIDEIKPADLHYVNLRLAF